MAVPNKSNLDVEVYVNEAPGPEIRVEVNEAPILFADVTQEATIITSPFLPGEDITIPGDLTELLGPLSALFE